MESGMMKVVFSSLVNREDKEISAYQEKLGVLESQCSKKYHRQSKISVTAPGDDTDDYVDKSSREVFTSLVNASNCANMQSEKMIYGFVTLTH